MQLTESNAVPSIRLDDWFAVYTRHQHERKVASLLAEQDYEIFYPTYSELHRWKDRKKEVTLPLFPGYVFFARHWKGMLVFCSPLECISSSAPGVRLQRFPMTKLRACEWRPMSDCPWNHSLF